MKARAIETRRGIRCRVFEAGSGAPLVFFHGAGGLLRDNPFLDDLATRHHVLAPEWPGYGESTGEELLEDMLDFALHGWDLVDALGLSRPHVIGHSMANDSPFFHDREGWRNDHTDWQAQDVRELRRRL
jgi:pimeloyl-ACP methyl ester carboxylesterase